MASKHIKIRDASEIPGKIIDDIWVFPCIKTPGSSGKTLIWQVYVYAVNGQRNDIHPPVGNVIDTTTRIIVPRDSRLELKPLLENKQIPGDYVGVIRVDSKNGVDGKIRDSSPTYVTTGKNIGKSDETNAVFQALRDAYGLYHTKLRKTQGNDSSDLIMPMLAESVESLDSLKYPVCIQRKYDGLRAISTILAPADPSKGSPACDIADPSKGSRACDTGEHTDTTGDEAEKSDQPAGAEKSDGKARRPDVTMYSRGLCMYSGHQAIRNELAMLLDPRNIQAGRIYLDGEFYKHGVPLQEISGSARCEDSESDLDYVVYDLFDANAPGMPFGERSRLLRDLLDPVVNEPKSRVKFAETFIANNPGEVTELYKRFLSEGYEGAIIRKIDSPYKQSRNGLRSPDLLKMKPVHDHEFKVTGWTTGKKGKSSDAFMIICETEEGETFPVTPALELDVRNKLTAEMRDERRFREKFMGKKIKVYYEDMSKAGIPLRARTKLEIRAEGY